MTEATTKHTVGTATPATGEPFSFTHLEDRLEVLRNGARVLLAMASGDGFEPKTGEAVCWVVALMLEAEHDLHEMFGKMIEQKRQDWNERDAALAELRAHKAAPVSETA